MNQTELKKTLKPLIKQCIKEVIFEDGTLSGIITEIVKGLGAPQMVAENKQTEQPQSEGPSIREQERQIMVEQQRAEHKAAMEDQRRGLTETISGRLNGVNVFEGVNPISKAGAPSGATAAPSSPLDGVDPMDPGVDISKLGIF
jgi:hypothetical protein|tara:strand:- start:536 stop:967 length:432 start_codon:yes stop_codon:yes gene_type:complete